MKRYFLYCIFTLICITSSTLGFALPSCQRIFGVIGPEDITIDQKTGIAYISAQDRRPNPWPTGGIYTYDLHYKTSTPILMHRTQPALFHPHGISLLITKSGKYLFVVNHRTKTFHTIEIFKIAGKQLILTKSVTDPRLKSPDDIYGIGINKFYVTNFSYNNVLYYDGKNWSEVAKNIGFANGINGYKNKLFIVSTEYRNVYYFKINSSDGSLQLIDIYPVGFFGDNLERDTEGNYWLAGHINPIKFLCHWLKQKFASPSRVIKFKITPQDNNQISKFNIFYDNGKFLSASSVAAPYKNEFLVGDVFSPFFLRCK